MRPGSHSTGDRPASHVTTMHVPGGSMTARVSVGFLCGRDEEGNLGLLFIDAPGVELERCGLGSYMGERVLNLHGSSRANSSA
jgi:hypothetical protein